MKKTALALTACAFAARAWAGVFVTSALDRARVATDDQLVLSVTVTGDQASVPEPKLPPIEAFSVYDSGRSQSISIVNGHVASSVVYTYVLTPRSVGRFRIPPIGADGAAQASAPIDVEVVKPGVKTAPAPDASAAPDEYGPPSADQANSDSQEAPADAQTGRTPAAMVVATLDKSRATVNEQVTLTVRFLYSQEAQLLGNQQYEAPNLTGFLSVDLPPVRNGTTVIGGRPYAYSEIKTALFPIQSGRLKIGPASVHAQVARPGGDPFAAGFFNSFFANPQAVVLHSDPLTLRVDPPPPGKPADFTGVVGKLSARASVDRADVKAGEAVTLTVEVSGSGNVQSIPEPAKPDVPALRFFDTESSVTTDKAGDRITGRKTFRTVVVPRVSGDAQLPSFRFPYYDPQSKAFAVAATAPISLRVAPGAPGAASAMPGPTAAAPGVTAFGEDVRYLKTAPEQDPFSASLVSFADLGPWHAAPFAALLVAALFDWRRRAADADPRGRRFRDARRRAEERLKAASSLSDAKAADAAAHVDEALAAFVADKLDVPSAGLTLKTALDGLKSLRRPPAEPTLARLSAAWEEADLRRFAPGGVDGSDARRFADEIADLIRTLDQEIGR
ncbi:MAG: protein BatD [Elusimicrobia bacterium]|nr:protein BatD [Elusimicrobiota bacterium]